ncbi:hypothetical protein KDW_41430 [Dictyobacter vulcani]|uniref:YokE-like PH domain-containing protein n=1 Tax=Dictyobacter vulcani TaxID=2607529 RepID=A0A5J4KU35_9CHLR|nr:hypothetical protein [Dictyobacter vulcani]GER89981.1 hypothetical protein KDW_41430 [Dictyobacter vulcani]
MESSLEVEFPRRMYQLAEQHDVGQPLVLYNLQPKWKRYINLINYFLLTLVICTALFVLIGFAIFFYQFIEHQIVNIEWDLQMTLFGAFMGLLGCVFFMFIRYMLTQRVPISCLVCTEGLLMISQKKAEVIIQWNEVRRFLEVPALGKRKRYIFYRVNQASITFSNIYEDMDDLIDHVRHHIPTQL